MSFGIYIHWPYCARICPYCDFNVYRARGHDEAPLLAAIAADMKGHAEKLGTRTAETLFLGGGTPSLLSARAIATLITAAREHFNLRADAEITLEANPEDRARFAQLRAAGINRFSIGVQALRDADLKALGRTHDVAAARAAVEAAAQTGARVSLDLIYAREGQHVEDWAQELREALALPVEHYSLYQLTIAPRTAFGRAAARGDLKPPDDDGAAHFYEITQEMCAAAGAPAYEISNHARMPAARSRHNLIYWRGGEWIGIGPGAHGRVTIDGQRHASTAYDRPNAYINAVNTSGLGWAGAETLTDDETAEEALVMGLRTDEGVARGRVEAIIDATKASDLAQQGFLCASSDRLVLAPRGRLVADRIAADLLRR